MGKCIITIEDGEEHPVSVTAEFDRPFEEMKRDQSFTFAQMLGLDCVRYIQEAYGDKASGDQAPASVPQ